MINQNKMTAVEKIIEEINNELQTLESLHGSEIMGRKIGLTFAKRIAEQAKEMENKTFNQEEPSTITQTSNLVNPLNNYRTF